MRSVSRWYGSRQGTPSYLPDKDLGVHHHHRLATVPGKDRSVFGLGEGQRPTDLIEQDHECEATSRRWRAIASPLGWAWRAIPSTSRSRTPSRTSFARQPTCITGPRAA